MSAEELFEVDDATPSRALTIRDLRVGLSVVQRVRFGRSMLDHFGKIARDRAPVHHDPRFAQGAGFDRPIVQGLALATRFSRLIGMYLPGEHAILEKIEFVYRRPVFLDQPLVYIATVDRIAPALRIARLTLGITVEGIEHVTGHCQCLVR